MWQMLSDKTNFGANEITSMPLIAAFIAVRFAGHCASLVF
jgi:hypothetical protein